jgi:hypothetical protein
LVILQKPRPNIDLWLTRTPCGFLSAISADIFCANVLVLLGACVNQRLCINTTDVSPGVILARTCTISREIFHVLPPRERYRAHVSTGYNSRQHFRLLPFRDI